MKKVKKLYKNPIVKIFAILIISTLFITIGYSALSTSLSVNGTAMFEPVGMIRVMSIEQKELTDAVEIEKGYSKDSINVQIEINELTGSAVYDVNITNLGQTDKMLSQIIDEVYSNENIEYELNGLSVDDVIKAGQSVDFTITFKYKDGISEHDNKLNSEIKFVFDDYVDNTVLFPTIFKQDGACTFNGAASTITGDECSKYWDSYYIDTGIALYSEENWNKDYEIGFTIEEYDGTNQDTEQSVFVNTKKEIGNKILVPGLVFRRKNNATELELTQYFNTSSSTSFKASEVKQVRILRIDGIVYYSINNGTLKKLQDISDINSPYYLTTWFGAAPDSSGNPMRQIKATLSNIYIKLGKYEPNKYTVTFNANGGTVSENSREVDDGDSVGSLPTPTNGYKSFEGWYLDQDFQTLVDENYVVLSDVTLYAKWGNSVAKINDKKYASFSDAVNDVTSSDGQTTIELLEDTSDSVTIDSGKNIIINLNNHTISNSTNYSVIINKGQLKVTNGTLITNSNNNAVINNESTGKLEIEDLKVTSNGQKQCIYNDGGTLTISGASYFQDSSSIRATIHNLHNGTTTIFGGTFISDNYSAILNDSATLVIGIKDGSIDSSTPLIQGKIYGISSSSNFSLYDGIIKGVTASVNNTSKITSIEDNSEIINGSETIDGLNFTTLFLK